MDLSLKWKQKTGIGGAGEYLIGHGIVLASYDMCLISSQKEWVGRLGLPGLNKVIVECDTREEVRSELEGIVKSWFERLLGEENNIDIKVPKA